VTRALVIAIVVAAACEQEGARPTVAPELPHNVALAPAPAVAPASSERRIEDIPGLDMGGYDQARQDCRLSAVARRAFAGARVRACGTIDLGGSGTLPPLVRCVTAALAAGRPFIAEQQIQGIDSGVAEGLVGVLDGSGLALYGLSYDSNPCGGGCPERGHTTVVRCDRLTPVGGDCTSLGEDCFACVRHAGSASVREEECGKR
jgi:hypothetical protein